MDSQIKYLKNQIECIESSLANNSSKVPVNFSQTFSIASLIRRSIQRNPIFHNSNLEKTVPIFIEDALKRARDKVSNMDLLKFNMKQQGKTVYDTIEPYFADIVKVMKLLNRFFNTELYANFIYIDKKQFNEKVDNFFSSKRGQLSPNDYAFMGQLLIIMRISYISSYNCGYDEKDEDLYVGCEASHLASLCFEEGQFPLHIQDIDTIRLMLLIFDYTDNSPESIDLKYGGGKCNEQSLVRLCVGLKYNIDPLKSKDSNFIRIIWHRILDLERTDLIYNGFSVLTDSDTYTTTLPVLGNPDNTSFENMTLKRFHDRDNNFRELIFKVFNMVTNTKNPPTLDEFQVLLDKLVRQCNESNLEFILKLDSDTEEQRCLKAFKFIDFLDFHCMAFMLAYKVFSHIEDQPASSNKKGAIENVIRIGNSIITLAYFIDPHQQHFYNLREHFGYNIQLIPKIVQILHRVITLQYALLTKSCFQNSLGTNFKLHEIKRITFQNIKVSISSFGKIADNYLHAKRLYMVHSYFVLKFFGQTCNIPDFLVASLKEKNFQTLSEEDSDCILKNLIELTGDRAISENFQDDNLVRYFETLITDLPEPFTLEKIDQFLSTINLGSLT